MPRSPHRKYTIRTPLLPLILLPLTILSILFTIHFAASHLILRLLTYHPSFMIITMIMVLTYPPVLYTNISPPNLAITPTYHIRENLNTKKIIHFFNPVGLKRKIKRGKGRGEEKINEETLPQQKKHSFTKKEQTEIV